jgi:hypothetical protein
MPLRLSELTRIAETVVAEHDSALRVVGIASSDGESGRVELLVSVSGCHREPCTISLNVSRQEEGRFKDELMSQLRSALRSHASERDVDQSGSASP